MNVETGENVQQSIGESVASAAATLTEQSNQERGEGGRFAGKEPADKGQSVQAAVEAALELPGGKWTDEQKQLYGKLGSLPEGRTYQQFINDVYKSMQGDYTRKTQEVANFRREYDQFQQMLQPYLPQWQRAGVQPLQGMQQVLGWAQYVASNPKQGLLELAKTYGVDLSEAVQEQPYVDPAVQSLQQKLSQFEQNQHYQRVQAEQAQQAQILAEIQAFEEAQDESGNPAHPHFRDVYDDMIVLLQSGRFKDLQSAYDYATYGNRDVRTRLAEQAAKQDAAKRAAEAQKAVEASKSVSSKSGGKSPNTPRTSLREEIAALARAQSG